MDLKDDKNQVFFEGEVKPSVPCRKVLWNVEESYKYEKI
jgi:hypothetical protein